jgi:hypothetical protein
MNPVGWFEIATHDLDRATRFYEAVLQLKLDRHDMGPHQMAWFPMDKNAQGAAGTLIKGEYYTPSHAGTLIYFNVQDIPATLGRVAEQGGKVFMEKTSIGEYGFIGMFEDSEGNRIAIHSQT